MHNGCLSDWMAKHGHINPYVSYKDQKATMDNASEHNTYQHGRSLEHVAERIMQQIQK